MNLKVNARPGISPKNLRKRHSVNIAVRPAEPVVALTIDMNPLSIHLGRAPLAALVLSAIDPLSAGEVGGA